MLKISPELANRIGAYGSESYPHECCGALLGSASGAVREVVHVVALVNRRQDSPHNRFVITPEDVRAAEKEACERGMELIGWYHSHPDHPARPSEFDREHAWPWYSYLIVSVEARRPAEMAAWRLADDRSGFVPEEIEIGVRATA